MERHFRAYPRTDRELLPVGGVLQWRRDGELHVWNPTPSPSSSTPSARTATPGPRKASSPGGQRRGRAQGHLRGLLKFKPAGRRRCRSRRLSRPPRSSSASPPAPCASARFSKRSARDAGHRHEPASAARSNTGEGGEDAARFLPDANGDQRRSAIKQVASGRFGVTDPLPGQRRRAPDQDGAGRQARRRRPAARPQGRRTTSREIRHSTPGVGLISPPPHHDIYSIEDLEQLIYDLKIANPHASDLGQARLRGGRGHGGRGRGQGQRRPRHDHRPRRRHRRLAPSSIQSAGIPWEIGLAETQHTLLLNDLRSRITVEVDGRAARPAATSWSPRCWAPRSSASPPPR